MFTANVLIAWALILGTAGFVIFGSLSDRIGRKPIILTGCVIAALTYFPVFSFITRTANPKLHAAQQNTAVVITADPRGLLVPVQSDGNVQVHQLLATWRRPCSPGGSVNYSVTYVDGAVPAKVKVGDTEIASYDASTVSGDAAKAAADDFAKAVNGALGAGGYPIAGQPNDEIVKIDNFFDIFGAQQLKLILVLTYLVILVTMVYGPIAAALVELFPTRIRYTGMSLPYHIGNGWFGGLMPATAFAMIAQTGDVYYGLWYPIVIALAPP